MPVSGSPPSASVSPAEAASPVRSVLLASEDWWSVWIGLLISWIFFHGIKPPIVGG